jgi:hypothetical protein
MEFRAKMLNTANTVLRIFMVIKLDREPEARGSRNCKSERKAELHRLHRLDSGSNGNQTSPIVSNACPSLTADFYSK